MARGVLHFVICLMAAAAPLLLAAAGEIGSSVDRARLFGWKGSKAAG